MKVREKALTFSDMVFPRAGIFTNAALVVGFGLLTGLAAQLGFYLPFSPVPVTGQTLVPLLAGALLGSRRGALSQLVYIAEGAVGLPVFAAGHSGVAYMVGLTGGYLAGFVAAAFVVGLLAERGWDRSYWKAVVAMVAGSVALYLLGLAWLGHFVPTKGLLLAGLYPFIPGDLAKIALATAAIPSGWKLMRWLQRS